MAVANSKIYCYLFQISFSISTSPLDHKDVDKLKQASTGKVANGKKADNIANGNGRTARG